MNNTCSLASFFLAAFACLLPTSANAQMIVSYDQSLAPMPIVSQFGNPVVDGPLTFSQANTYSTPPAYSPADVYSQPLTFSQANTYMPPPVYSQPHFYSPTTTYLQPNIAFDGVPSSGHSSIPANTAEVVIPQPPVYSAPIESPSAIQPHVTARCST